MSLPPTQDSTVVESNLQESRKFPPPGGFVAQAHIKSVAEYEALYRESIDNPEKFWAEKAADLHWFKKWGRVLEWEAPDARWFVGGKTNLCYNCIDRQIDAGLGDQVAIIWEAEALDADGQPRVTRLTYNDLLREVSRFANVLKRQGVKKGDVVTIYMPMIPELVFAMLACARIGAPHSIIFGGFSANAIRDRVEDGRSSILITADGGWRRGHVVPLKENCDEAMTLTDRIKTCITVKHTGHEVAMKPGRDVWWHDLMRDASDRCPAEELDSEDLAFILYTSGSTGKPKGIMHTTGGYMVYTYLTTKLTFDLKSTPAPAPGSAPGSAPGNDPTDTPSADAGDVYWCTADIGWITGHSYIIYGVLPNRVPTLMYEGAPNFPDWERFWSIIQRHKVTKFYTAPTAIRAFMKQGEGHPNKYDLSSLKVLGTVGEPINPEAWMWYHRVIGGGRCPIVDTWWQTETGGHMLTPLPGVTTTVPGSCTTPMLGIDAAVVGDDGKERKPNEGGILVIRKPWPSMLRGIYGDRQRFIDTYWSTFPLEKAYYTAGDGARRDEDGNFWIMGRIDDVIIVAGHNIGTMEVESALVSHPAVAEAAVVGYPHDVKGNAIAGFVILRGKLPGPEEAKALKKELSDHTAKALGPITRPDKIILTEALPKTRSGKIMRRLLRDIAAGVEITQDTTTLEDRGIVAKLQAGA